MITDYENKAVMTCDRKNKSIDKPLKSGGKEDVKKIKLQTKRTTGEIPSGRCNPS
jgi:hypothetical protein